ncbi:MAG: helix-turn-helix domain-containing protein [Lachnospiraceae bacterium]|nr:helix-turn-helix domain-containing protein [Lachnospiraceae bacterium]
MAEVGKHIKKIRKERNLTQDDLADRLHCTRQTISNYETGKSEPGIEILIELAGVLGVEINDLIYGPQKRENRKRQRNRAVAALAAACVLLTVISILAPFAQQYSWRYFGTTPIYLLQYLLRPFALAMLGWGIAEAAKAFAGIRIWEGRKQRTLKIGRIFFWVIAALLAVFAVLTLWTAIDLTYSWWLSERMRKLRMDFDSSTVPPLIPEKLRAIHFRVVMRLVLLNHSGIGALFYGAALGICRIEKEEKEEAEKEI